MKLLSLLTCLLPAALCFTACKSSKSSTDTTASTIDSSLVCPVVFNADSAYHFAQKQCDFGPRIPGSAANKSCGEYILAEFARFGLTTSVQATTVTGWDGTKLPCRNLIAQYRPEAKERIVLAAHYDSRPWSDQDADSTKHRQPVMAADDGASGVAVMLEVARNLQQLNPAIGIDFVCFDVEDYGAPYWAPESARNDENTFCLGSQYWSAQAAAQNYRPRFGILLDMVGGSGNQFRFEGYSLKYAQSVAVRLWDAARYAGAESCFIPDNGGFITDDHLPMNTIAGIPTVDVIAYSPDGGFPAHWHTTHDTMDKLDTATLRAVGQSLLQLLSQEK